MAPAVIIVEDPEQSSQRKRPMKTFYRFSFRIALLIAMSFAALECGQAQCTFTNGTFEDGTLNSWTVYSRPTGSSTWFNWSNTLTPISSHTISAPPQGTRAAVTDQIQATTHAMYQTLRFQPDNPVNTATASAKKQVVIALQSSPHAGGTVRRALQRWNQFWDFDNSDALIDSGGGASSY
jgi:hypothetical protein